MQGEGLKFVRYADDFRVFCRTRKDAYIALATLAEILWKSHGLTLAGEKTSILQADDFKVKYSVTERQTELMNLLGSFGEIVEALGLDNWYDEINYDDLDSELKKSVDALNLEELLTKQLTSENIDIRFTKFVLRRLGQLQDDNVAYKVLRSIDNLYPAFIDVIGYFQSLKHLSKMRRRRIGKTILRLMDDSIVSHLEYHRLHLLQLFASNPKWENTEKIVSMWPKWSDNFTRRELILALGISGQNYWFRQRKTEWQQFSPWERRAFLRGASSLEFDERRNWYDSVRDRLDPLEGAVVSWSRQHPINS